MKIISAICLGALIICQIGNYLSIYWLGRLEKSVWDYFDPLFTALMVLVLLFILVCAWVISLLQKRNRLWTTAMMLVFIACICSELFLLPRPGSFLIYGIRNHVMEDYTLDDLRHFSLDVHQEMPGIDVDENEVGSTVGKGHGAYEELSKKYSFMKWGIGGKGNPYIYEKGDAMIVEWGGALTGHWGFSINIDGGKNEPESDTDTQIIRMSDDIYFYSGD